MPKTETRIQTAMLAIATGLTLLLFWPAMKFGWEKWGTDPNYGHGYFVPIAAAYLVWRKKETLRSLAPAPSLAGLAFVIPSVAFHVLSNNADLLRFSMAAFVTTLAGLVILFAGWKALRVVAFPLLFLFFAVPIPLFLESTTLPMKIAASAAAVKILNIIGLVVYREGTIIHLSDLSLEVATACSGIRSLVLVCTVGAFYGYVTQSSLLRRAAVFISSIPIALCANVVRIVATAVLVNYVSTEAMRKTVHDGSGAFVFVVAGVMFVVVGAVVDGCADYWARRHGAPAAAGLDAPESDGAATR